MSRRRTRWRREYLLPPCYERRVGRPWWWLQIERVCSSSQFPVPVAFPIGGWISAERYQGGLKDEFPQRWSTTAGHILYLSPGRIWICQLPPRKFSVWSSPSTRGRIIINFNLLIISCQQFENNLIVGFVPLPPLQNIAKNFLHKIRNTREAPPAAAVIVQLRNSSIHPSVHLTSGVLIFVQRISLFPGVNRCSVITLPTVCSYHRIHIFSISWWINCLKEASLTQATVGCGRSCCSSSCVSVRLRAGQHELRWEKRSADIVSRSFGRWAASEWGCTLQFEFV